MGGPEARRAGYPPPNQAGDLDEFARIIETLGKALTRQ